MSTPAGLVFLVDDDPSVRKGLGRLLQAAGFDIRPFDSPSAFLAAPRPEAPSCLILDQRMPEHTGLELQRLLQPIGDTMPIIFLTGHGDVAMSVQAMKAGAFDYLTKPVDAEPLLEAVTRALEASAKARGRQAARDDFSARVALLTPRERDVCLRVVRGLLNKQIAGELGIAEKTVKIHRANAMAKLAVGSVAELSRLVERTGVFVES
jgi:FixJ family two-component response regulator